VPFIDKLILVNDGSTDGTESIINFSDKIILINFKNNLGKGAALTAGFNDLQHPPEEIPNFIKEMEKYDILIGNRLNNIKNMPLQRVFSNKLTSFFMSLKTKIKLPDTQCGFRAYRNDALKNILPKSKGYEAESEIIINAARQNYRIGFIKIPTIYANEKSKMKPVETIIGFIKILFI
jgi:glycosyltransferase involved in cell wall biosynthesis